MISDAPAVPLVEDNPDDEELILRGLKGTNLPNPVDVARDGQEALDHLFGNHDQAAKPVPVVVLLDLMLPRVDVSTSSRGSARRSSWTSRAARHGDTHVC